MSRFTAHDSGLQAIMNYPNMRGLLGRTPVKSGQPGAGHQRNQSFEFHTELEKWAKEMGESRSNDDKPFDDSKGPKRVRESPDPETESTVASPAKKQKTEPEDDDTVTLGQDDYSIWDALLYGSSYPGITESLSPSSPQSKEPLPDIGSISDEAPTIPKSWKFKIWEDEDAATDNDSMAGHAGPWVPLSEDRVPEHDDEDKENDPPEFDVAAQVVDDVSESEDYDLYVWSRQFPRTILGELQRN